MSEVDEAIVVMWEQGYNVSQIASITGVSTGYVHYVLDYYGL